MGRFYNVSGQAPQFIDGLYTPPWEMMDKALSYNQEGYDNALATTDLFENLDIQHIEDPIVKEQVQKIKDYYSGKINSISEAIKANPMDWKKSRVSIENLSKDLQENLKNGEIARIQKAAGSLSNFLEQHKDFRTKNPGLFNQAYNYFLEQYQKDPLRLGNFDWETIVNPIDEERMNKRFKDIMANVRETTEGMWKVGTEEVSKDRILESAKAQVYGDPENRAFIQQQIKFKNPDYYNEEYAKLTGGDGYYEKLYYSTNSTDEKGNPEMLDNEEVYNREKKYLEAVDQYIKDSKEGKKNLVIPERDYIIKEGAIQKLFNAAVSEHAYNKQTIDKSPVYFANLSAALQKKALQIKEKESKSKTKDKIANITVKNQVVTNALATVKEMSIQKSLFNLDDPTQKAKADTLQMKIDDSLGMIDLVLGEIIDLGNSLTEEE